MRVARTVISVAVLVAAVVVPAHAVPNASCDKAAKMTDVPPSSPLPMYPAVNVATGSVGGVMEHAWFYGTFNDIAITAQDAVTMTIYTTTSACTKEPVTECSVAVVAGTPARCTFAKDAARHYVDVSRPAASGDVQFSLETVYHCLKVPQQDGCAA